MKKKLKGFLKVVAFCAVIVAIAIIILLIPGATSKVAEWTGTSVQKVKDTLVTVAVIGIGLMLVSFAVGSIALPVLAVPLAVVGVALIAWGLYTSGWFGNSSSTIPIDSKGKLQKIA